MSTSQSWGDDWRWSRCVHSSSSSSSWARVGDDADPWCCCCCCCRRWRWWCGGRASCATASRNSAPAAQFDCSLLLTAAVHESETVAAAAAVGVNESVQNAYHQQQSITLLRNNILQRNLVIAAAMYCRLSARNFIQIHSDLTFLLYDF